MDNINDDKVKVGDELLSDSSPVKGCYNGMRTTAIITFELLHTSGNCCEECAVQRYCEQFIEKQSIRNPKNDLEELIFTCIYQDELSNYTIKVKKD